MNVGKEKDFRPIVVELRHQNWNVEQTSQGHWKAVPSDPTKKLVHFSASAEPRAIKNTIQDLKKSGFVWPPIKHPSSSNGKSTAPREPEWFEQEEEPVTMTHATHKPTPTPKPIEDKEAKMDRLWTELKEAKAYRDLTNENMQECETKLLAAQRAFDEAREENRKANEALGAKKREFDTEFGAAA